MASTPSEEDETSWRAFLRTPDLILHAFGRRSAEALPRIHRCFERQHFIDILADLGFDFFQFVERQGVERTAQSVRTPDGFGRDVVRFPKRLAEIRNDPVCEVRGGRITLLGCAAHGVFVY